MPRRQPDSKENQGDSNRFGHAGDIVEDARRCQRGKRAGGHRNGCAPVAMAEKKNQHHGEGAEDKTQEPGQHDVR